jgi:hypothetical protein
MPEVTCEVCSASQWPTADCLACGHPLPPEEDVDRPDGLDGDGGSLWD